MYIKSNYNLCKGLNSPEWPKTHMVQVVHTNPKIHEQFADVLLVFSYFHQ